MTRPTETDFEIIFIRDLGKFSAAGKRISRRDLLRLYIMAASKRVDWDGIDRERAVSFAAAEIKRGGVVDGSDEISS
ncbi:hypothetical protein [Candidatus Manganitrophus noduliformans]|uniref:Uncharacterized protein n=1 Tax=Candidatus Manganitrophus noduliformans TaxID=2606439 RepID=A0A7X6IB97_9BACT|nr:hypothetical protein [Candidatus Manganitrophus noduliformans]NKE71256.1 hypothetical protein [Candidatus Manganitrophus noduliformans]